MKLKTVEELKEYVSTLPGIPAEYKIAVGGLIFDAQNRVILLERGEGARDSRGKLEGVGGGVEPEDVYLHEAFLREVREEIGDVDVEINDVLTVMTLPGETDGRFWVVVVYLCRMTSGEPVNREPHKCKTIHRLSLAEIEDDRLSEYQKVTMAAYRAKFGDSPYYEQARERMSETTFSEECKK